MIIVVKGTPDSGKSALAEKLCCELAGTMKKYYIATMVPYGEAGIERIRKHRKMREGKGFETIEKSDSLDRIEEAFFREECTCLLECVSNLVGNEMYADKNHNLNDSELKSLIIESIKNLGSKVTNLVVVTNEFPKEMDGYDDETRRYVHITDIVNDELKKYGDKVYEYREGEWIEYDNY